MKKLLTVSLLLLAAGAFAETTSYSLWLDAKVTTGNHANQCADFLQGYFGAISDTVDFTMSERITWSGFSFLINGNQGDWAVTTAYKDPALRDVPYQVLLRAAVESAISKQPGGLALLNKVYARRGGWKPFTTFEEWKASFPQK